MAYSVVLLLVIIAVVKAQEPTLCCAPEQFLIDEAVIITEVNNGTLITTETLLTRAYDYKNKLMAVEAETYNADTGEYDTTKTIFLFPQDAEYVISAGTCTKKVLSYNLGPICVPPGSTYDRTFSVGLGQYTVNEFSLNAPVHPDYNLRLQFQFGEEKCIPYSYSNHHTVASKQLHREHLVIEPSVWQMLYGTNADENLPVKTAVQYSNYVEGIADPSKWFKLPDECKKVAEKQDVDAMKMVKKLRNFVKVN